MTRKERFERALRHEEVDRVPFWVKVFGQSYRMLQPKKWREMDELELVDYLDLDHYAGCPAPAVCENERVTEKVDRSETRTVTRHETPDGTLTAVRGWDASSASWHPTEFPIKSVEDIPAALHVFEGNQWRHDESIAERARERIQQVGDRGTVHCGMRISPLMNLIQHWLGPQATYFFLLDHPAEMEELIGAMHEERLRFLDALLVDCPADWIVSVENTSTTLLSPEIFERYCFAHLTDYGTKIREAGKHHMLHQCGKLYDLLPMIDRLPAEVIEAYTAPTLGDTTVADRNERAPSMAIIGGTQAPTWLRPVDEICEIIQRDLREAGSIRGVVLTSAGVMPPGCSIEKIKQVRERMYDITWDSVA
ncbi:MAG: uroporphyrinogen decarboxylase family protein [Armatimonadota bacterium]